MADDNGKRSVLVPILWSACCLLAGGFIGNLTGGSLSQAEANLLMKQGQEMYDRIDVTNSDQESRIRLLEKTNYEMAADIKAIRREIEGFNGKR